VTRHSLFEARYVLRPTVTDLPAIAMSAEVEGAIRGWRWQAGTSGATEKRRTIQHFSVTCNPILFYILNLFPKLFQFTPKSHNNLGQLRIPPF
jgi:hypothetical protein